MSRSNILICATLGIILAIVVLAEEPSELDHSKDPTIVHYYTQWSMYGRAFAPTEVDYDNISYLQYAFYDISEQCELLCQDNFADNEKVFPDTPRFKLGQSAGGKTGALAALLEIKKQLRKEGNTTKFLISVGGWSYSKFFSVCVKHKHIRQTFVSNIIKFAISQGSLFDGVDIDWEFPTVKSTEHDNTFDEHDWDNYVQFLLDLRHHFKTAFPKEHKDIFIAHGPGAAYNKTAPMGQICNIVDGVNLMAYDFYGPWGKDIFATHNAPLYHDPNNPYDNSPESNVAWFVNKVIERGCPPNKMILGLAAYGRTFFVKPEGREYSEGKLGPGKWERGVSEYYCSEAKLLTGYYQRFFNPVAKVPYLISEVRDPEDELFTGVKKPDGKKDKKKPDGKKDKKKPDGKKDKKKPDGKKDKQKPDGKKDKQKPDGKKDESKEDEKNWPEVREFVSYDDAESLSYKIAFAKEKGLKGFMIWSADQDKHKILSRKSRIQWMTGLYVAEPLDDPYAPNPDDPNSDDDDPNSDDDDPNSDDDDPNSDADDSNSDDDNPTNDPNYDPTDDPTVEPTDPPSYDHKINIRGDSSKVN